MLKRSFILLWVLLSACNYSSNASPSPTAEAPPPAPQTAASAPALSPLLMQDPQKKAFQYGSKILSAYHYRPQALADIANDVHNDFIQALDPNHLYLLQSDIADLYPYHNSLATAATRGDLSAPIAIYQRYRQRALALSKWSLERLQKPIDLTGSEQVIFPKRKELKNRPWLVTLDEAKAEQERRLKDQLIRLMIGGKSKAEAIKSLKKRYESAIRRLAEFSGEDLFDVYMNVIAHRFDPHSDYFSPRHSKDFNTSMSLALEGIGAILSNNDDKVTIRELVPGGPAEKSGKLHIKDQIIGIAQGEKGEMVDIIGWRLDKAVDLIRGKKGTKVRLQIEPANAAKGVHEVTIIRDKINLEESAAKATVETVTENGISRKIGVIKLPSFYIDFAGANAHKKDYRSTTRDVKRLIEDLKKQKVDGIAIDLRNNGGGSLQEAVQMLGLFIKKGPVVLISNNDGSARAETDDSNRLVYDGPLAVLINHFSASASEIFAAAIQDYHRGIIIGSNSYGKGTVQTVMPLDKLQLGNLGNIKFTVSMFHRITGGSTQLRGVKPDVTLPEIFNLSDVGEQSEEYALPWKSIPPARGFALRHDVTPQIVAALQQRAEARAKSDKAMNLYRDYVHKMAEKEQQEQWSLNLAARKKEFNDWKKYQENYKAALQKIVPPLKADAKIKAKIDERNAATEDEEEKEIFVPDVALYESLLIFDDYLQLLHAQK